MFHSRRAGKYTAEVFFMSFFVTSLTCYLKKRHLKEVETVCFVHLRHLL